MHVCIFVCIITGMFLQQAIGPTSVCMGNSAEFNCSVQTLFDSGVGYVKRDAVWSRNGTIITDDTPGHTLLRTGNPPIVTGLMVDNTSVDDDGTVYNCTVAGAPANFTSSAVLNVSGSNYILHTD